MNNLLSYCGLVDARKSTSEKDLPVLFWEKRWPHKFVSLLLTFNEHIQFLQKREYMCSVFSEYKGEKYQNKPVLFVLIKSRMSEHYLHA